MRPIVTIMLAAALTACLAPSADAASRRECQSRCATQILACQDACVPYGGGVLAPGGRPLVKACRKAVLKRCRKEGVATCETTGTTLPGVTTTTVPGGGTSTTTIPPSTTTTSVQSTTTSTAPPSGLAGLIGRWRFQFTIISTFVQEYILDHVETVDGTPALIGTDEFGDLVIVGRTADFGGGVPYEFAMLDPGFTICDFFLFDRTGSTSISGEYWLTDVDFDGSCGDLLGGPYPLTGTRLASALGLSRLSSETASLRARQRLDEVLAAGASPVPPALQTLVDRLSHVTR